MFRVRVAVFAVAIAASVLQIVSPPAAHAAAPAFVQSPSGATSDSSGSSLTKAFSANNTAGNTIVAAVSWDGTATLTCSDTRGNAYATAVTTRDTVNNQSIGVYYATNIAAGADTVTATFSASSTFRRLVINEYSGLATSSLVDVTATGVGQATTATNFVKTSNATTTTSGDLIFGTVMDTDSFSSITAGTGFTQRGYANNKDLATQDKLQSSAGSVASTQTFSTTHRYAAVMVAFKPAGPPPATPSFVQSTETAISASATSIQKTFTSNVTQACRSVSRWHRMTPAETPINVLNPPGGRRDPHAGSSPAPGTDKSAGQELFPSACIHRFNPLSLTQGNSDPLKPPHRQVQLAKIAHEISIFCDC